MTPLTLKCDNPSIECNGHSVQVVGTLQIQTTATALANFADVFASNPPLKGADLRQLEKAEKRREAKNA